MVKNDSFLLHDLPFFEKAPYPYLVLNLEGRILAVNQAAEELLGWTSEEVVGWNFHELMPDQEEWAEEISKEGDIREDLVSLITKDQAQIKVELRGRLLKAPGDEGQVTIWMVRKIPGNAAVGFLPGEASMQHLMEHIPAAVSIKDAREKILFANRKFAETIQRAPEELIGLNSAEITPPELLEQYHRENQRVLAGETLREESVFPGPEGETYWVTEKFPLPLADGSILVGSISTEITGEVQTERLLRRMQQELREQEGKFRLLAEYAQDMIVLFDPEYQIEYLNPAAERILGFSLEDFQDREVFEVIHPGDVLELRQKFQKNIAQRQPSDLKWFRILNAAGEAVWCEAATSYEYDREGELKSVLVNARDISRRRDLQQELKTQELKYRALYENAPLPYQSLDEKGKILDVNPAWLRALGYQREEVIGRDFREFLHPSSRIGFREKFEHFKKVSYVRDVHFRMRHRDGRELQVSFEGCVGTNPEGDFQQTYCVFQDITDQKRAEEILRSSEERFRLNYQKTPVMMHSINQVGELVEVSDYWLKVMGYQRPEVIGRRSTEFLTEDSRRYAERVNLPKFFEEGEAWDVHYQFVTKSGEVLDVLMSAVAEYDQQGEYLRSLAVMEDVTERMAIQTQLKESEQKYRRLIDNSPDIFYIYSLERGALFWSKQVQEILGFEPEDLLRNSYQWDQAIHPEDRVQVREVLQDLQPGDSFALEYRIIDQEGFRHWLLDRSISVREHHGEILVEGLAKDITPRKQLEIIQDLRLQLVENTERYSIEELLRLALDKAEEVTESWIGFCHFLDADQETIRLQTWSTHTEAVMCTAEGHGLHYPLSKAGVWAEAIRQRRPVIHNDYSALKNKRGMPEGHAPVVRELVIPVFRQNRIVAVFGLGNKPTPYSEKDLELVSQIAEYVWDIVSQKRVRADLKKSENRYRGIVEDQTELICRYTEEGVLTFVNSAYARFFGKTSEELIGSNLFALMPEEDREWVRQQFLELTPQKQVSRYRHRNYAADGSLRWVEWSDRVIYDDRGEYVEYQSVGHDIHEQVQLEEMLKKREEDYQELVNYLQKTSEEERSSIASEIHDSLGQSLTVIKFDLDWILKSLPEEDGSMREKVDSTMDTVDRMISQVRKIGTSLRPDLLDNLGLVAALEGLLENFGERSGLDCQLEVSGHKERLDPQLEVDVFRLTQEALTNVARHADADSVQLRLTMAEDQVYLEISDDGKGITAQRAAGPEAFGLISMRERARRWEGKFSIQGDGERGTTLKVSFSRKGEAADD